MAWVVVAKWLAAGMDGFGVGGLPAEIALQPLVAGVAPVAQEVGLGDGWGVFRLPCCDKAA